MVDRIPLFPTAEEDTAETGQFQFTGQRTVGLEEYGSSFINFYNTTLGLPTLEQETGIEVEEEDIAELAEPAARPEEGDGPDFRNILEQPLYGGEGATEASTVGFFNSGRPLQGATYNSYSEYLAGSNDGKFADRVPLIQNVLEPAVAGNFREIDLGAGFTSEAKATAKRVGEGIKEAPSRAERLFKGELTPEDSKKLAGGLMAVTGPVGAMAGTFIGGQVVQNAFGNNSFRPAGPLGFMADLVHAKQYDDMAKIRASVQAAGFTQIHKVDTGFAITVGNMGITRAPGSGTFTGNTQGMDIQQLLALEAVSKGYDPTRGRYNPLNPSKNETVEETGGMFVSDNPMDGFFRANGTFYSSRTGASAAYSNRRDAEKAAATAGISYDEFQDALSAARSGSKTLDAAIRDIKGAKVVARDSDGAAAQPRQQVTITQARPGEMPQSEAAAKAQREDSGDGGGGTGRTEPSGANWGAPSAGGMTGSYGPDPEAYNFREGGRVGLAMGGAPGAASGFVDRPPEQVPEGQTVADNRPAQLPEGAFVINAAAVEFAGSNDIKNMLLDAHKESMRRGLTVDKQGNGAKLIDVAISSGEVVVAPHLAKIIGYDRLEKINNRGKTETRERIEENGQQPVGAAEGGFIDYPGELGDIGEDVPMQIEVPTESLQKFKDFGAKKQKREDIKTFIKGLSDEEAMALLLLTETSSTVDPMESMEAIGEVVKNRADSDYKDFKKLNTVKDVLLQQTRRGAFQFSGLEPTTLYNRLKEVRKGTATQGLQKTFAAAQNVLSEDPDREGLQRLPYGTLFYTKTAAPSQWMRESKDLEFSMELGGHEFYRPFASPEYP